MRTTKPRYQQGTIDKVPRISGWVWRVGLRQVAEGKTILKPRYFTHHEFPAESDVLIAQIGHWPVNC